MTSAGQRARGCAGLSPCSSRLSLLCSGSGLPRLPRARRTGRGHRAVPQRHVRGTAAVQRQRLAHRNAGASNSHYREGDSMPFRAKLINLSTSGSHTLVIEHDTLDGGRHAYDYLTSYNRTEASADACSGISPCSGAGSSFPIPTDPALAFANASSSQAPGAISIWNGTITGIAYGASDPAGMRSLIVTFTASNATVVLAWAATSPPRSTGAQGTAPARSPAPRTTCGCSRSTAAAATWTVRCPPRRSRRSRYVHDAGELGIDHARPADHRRGHAAGPERHGQRQVSFFVCGPNLVSNPDCTAGGTAVGSGAILAGGSATSAGFTPTLPGKYCFRAQYSPDLFAQYSPGNHTNLTTECFERLVQPARHASRDQAGRQRRRRYQGGRRSSASTSRAALPTLPAARRRLDHGHVYTLRPAPTVSEDARPGRLHGHRDHRRLRG